METAAIILAAGKGTRMGEATINKVCFDCAGIPVIRRIVDNFRDGGITRFVIVVGHRAESVMRALSGIPGILYAYQAEQRGTGHAVGCGLEVLHDIGFKGNVLISMGDKIVSSALVTSLLSRFNVGSVNRAAPKAVLGVQRVAGPTSRGHVVSRDGKPVCIVEHKDAVRDNNTEALNSPFVNAAFYGFEIEALSAGLSKLKSDNAQGEFYLTDTIAQFAAEGTLVHYEVENPDDMLTYSTRPELRAISHRFLRKVSDFSTSTSNLNILSVFAEKYGDRPCIITSAPGRINLMGRHIEHRGGSTNMMATNQRMTFVVSPRKDDVVHIANLDPTFPEAEFRISEEMGGESRWTKDGPISTAGWLDYLELPQTKAELEATRGHWMNYIKGAVLRFQAAVDMPLCGMDILASGDIPIAAGLSSSSALVVATAEAVVALNELNLSTREFVDLCGEGEWFVGSRGGAGDHAAMKCAKAGCVTHLKFKPFEIGEVVPFPQGYAILVVQSGEQAKKSEGAREIFNSRIRDYETALAEVKKRFPALPLTYFRDLAFLPDADREKALGCLSGSVKGVATFGINECRRAEECLNLLTSGNYVALGAMMQESHNGDRIGYGQYECSTPKIDALCDRLNAIPGVLGSQLVGAGLGGCVIALIEAGVATDLTADLSKGGFESFVCVPSPCSRVEWGI